MGSSTGFNKNLRELSEILTKEESRLLRQYPDFTDDFLFRSAELWRAYFSEGIMLASGGVETSLFGLKDIQKDPALKSFNDYPGSSNAYAGLTQDRCKKFLLEEGIISNAEEQRSLVVAYSLGSHEGLMRAARLVYKKDYNDGFFIPIGSYGLIAAALRDLKPSKYDICLVKVDSSRGEKITLPHLTSLVKQNPSTKTLLIELKTTAGAVYTESELIDIISFCKAHRLFLFVDAAHLHMEFDAQHKFPLVSDLCQKLGYYDYLILFTGSKTYGLERARVGFVLFNSRHACLTLEEMDNQLIRMFGTFNDLPVVAAHHLLSVPVVERKKYLKSNVDKHRYNMNLMLAYIEGINSHNIDADLVASIKGELPEDYCSGINGLRVVFKPKSGLHLKVDLSQFRKKYFLNIQMFNAEILCYVLNKICGVVTLHSSQIMDPSGYGMRLGFLSRQDIHAGMQRIHNFLGGLTETPQPNPFMKTIVSMNKLIGRLMRQGGGVITISDNANHLFKIRNDVLREDVKYDSAIRAKL